MSLDPLPSRGNKRSIKNYEFRFNYVLDDFKFFETYDVVLITLELSKNSVYHMHGFISTDVPKTTLRSRFQKYFTEELGLNGKEKQFHLPTLVRNHKGLFNYILKDDDIKYVKGIDDDSLKLLRENAYISKMKVNKKTFYNYVIDDYVPIKGLQTKLVSNNVKYVLNSESKKNAVSHAVDYVISKYSSWVGQSLISDTNIIKYANTILCKYYVNETLDIFYDKRQKIIDEILNSM